MTLVVNVNISSRRNMCTKTALVLFRSAAIPLVSKREDHTTFMSALTGATYRGLAASDFMLID
jgi:hypothetical protein